MKHYEEVLKILHDKFDWKLTDSLTTTGKKLVADTIKALKIAENNQSLQLQQTGVISRFYTQKEVRELFIKLETERSKYYAEDANYIIPLDRFFLENGL